MWPFLFYVVFSVVYFAATCSDNNHHYAMMYVLLYSELQVYIYVY
jgi:hypothetical protein